jgi:hypothetical protein
LRRQAQERQQALSQAEVAVLVGHIWTMGLAGSPPSVGMVKTIAEEIALYCSKTTDYDPFTSVPMVTAPTYPTDLYGSA